MDLAPGNSNNTGQERKELRKKIKTQTKRAIFKMFPQQRYVRFYQEKALSSQRETGFLSFKQPRVPRLSASSRRLPRGPRARSQRQRPATALASPLQDAFRGMARACPTHNLVCLLVSPVCNTAHCSKTQGAKVIQVSRF